MRPLDRHYHLFFKEDGRAFIGPSAFNPKITAKISFLRKKNQMLLLCFTPVIYIESCGLLNCQEYIIGLKATRCSCSCAN